MRVMASKADFNILIRSLSAKSGSLASEGSARFSGKHIPEVNQETRDLKTGQQP